MSTLKKIADFTEERGLIREGDAILAAVSGGPDSICLLHFLDRYAQENRNVSLKVAYVHHHLRKQADKELAFVRGLCRKCRLPFYYRNIFLNRKKSLEETARKRRYQALLSIARKTGCNKIATGHTGDDQAETVIMRLLRGTGTAGLCAMAPVSSPFPDSRIRLIRPLLGISRKQILDYLKENSLKYSLDRSNLSRDFLRNRIRLEVLPFLEKFNPRIKEQIARSSLLLQDDFRFLKDAAEKAYEAVCREKTGRIFLKRQAFLKLPLALRRLVVSSAIMKMTGNPYRSFHLIENTRNGIEKNVKEILVPAGKFRLRREAGRYVFNRGRARKTG